MKPKLVRRQGAVWVLRALVGLGFISLVYYLSWWFVAGRLRSPVLVILFLFALLYSGTQMAGNWVLYLAARKLQDPPPPNGLSVDVFVTVNDECFDLIEKTLKAACAMRGKHKTWLLDDGSDPVLEKLALRLGAGYLTRVGHDHAKAGNVNAALPRTNGDVIAIFDVDHAPAPDFLEKSLGYFSDPRVGFVQVMLTFANGAESWVAQAALETSLEFYNPTSLGTDTVGGVTMMGSNALMRRAALQSIGGYQLGLAEDLATSIALHAAGWRSAYVREPLAPGLAPPSFTAWFTQQFKWARGVFELLLTAYPKAFKKLSWGQRLSYAVRMTKYWIGPAVALHLFATIGILMFGNIVTWDAFHQYLIQIAPLAIADILIRFTALRLWRHPSTPRTSLLRAVALVYATWPIYLMAWFMATLRLPLAFRPTPKTKSGRLNPLWLLPQIVVLLLLSSGTLYTVVVGGHSPSVLLVFVIAQSLLQLVLLYEWLRSDLQVPDRISHAMTALKEITKPRRSIQNVPAFASTMAIGGNGNGRHAGYPSQNPGLNSISGLYILQTGLQKLGAESGSLMIFDERGTLTEAAVAYQGKLLTRSPEHMAELVQSGLAGWVLRSGKPALVADTSADARWLRRPWEQKGSSRSSISVPIKEAERIAGILTLVHSNSERFAWSDLIRLQAITRLN